MADLNGAAAPTVRSPAGAVKLNGQIVAGWNSWEVENNVYKSADTFGVEFAASALPAAFNPAWFSSQKQITVEMFASETGSGDYQPASADRLIYGQVDAIDYDPVDGTLAVHGRDLTARFIDTKTSENHQNQTSSQVATLLANRQGLTPVVTSTTTLIGKFYTIDHTDINAEESEWDLLTKLAQFEGFDVFVVGNELHFQPKPTDTADRYVIQWTPAMADAPLAANTVALAFSRDLTIAKGVTVEVRSWNAKQKKAFTASWPRAVKGAKPGQSAATSTVYHYSIAGLTQDQAFDRAKKLYAQIVDRLVKVTASLPGDRLLTCERIVQVRGTGTAWDQDYNPDSVKRSMSIGEGYRMELTARTLPQDVEV